MNDTSNLELSGKTTNVLSEVLNSEIKTVPKTNFVSSIGKEIKYITPKLPTRKLNITNDILVSDYELNSIINADTNTKLNYIIGKINLTPADKILYLPLDHFKNELPLIDDNKVGVFKAKKIKKSLIDINNNDLNKLRLKNKWSNIGIIILALMIIIVFITLTFVKTNNINTTFISILGYSSVVGSIVYLLWRSFNAYKHLQIIKNLKIKLE